MPGVSSINSAEKSLGVKSVLKAAPPKAAKTYIGIPDSKLFDGWFETGYASLYSSNNNFGSDETREQTILYNDNGTATIQTYYMNDIGTEANIDEVIDVSFESTDWGGMLANITNIKFDIDEDIDYFKQGQIGDCAYLSGCLSLSKTNVGKQIIENSITKNKDNSYTLTFEGINKSVTFSQEDLKNARMEGNYSTGDNTVLLLELGAQKAIRELSEEFDISSDEIMSYYLSSSEADSETVKKVENMLNSPYRYLIMDCYWNDESPIDSFSIEKIMQLFAIPIENLESFGFVNTDKASAKKFLDNVDFGNSMNILDFRTKNADTYTSDNGKAFNILTNHAYTITNYNPEQETVAIVNPHNSSDSLTMTIGELVDCGLILYVCDLK